MKLRPAKDIINTLSPPPEKYWLKPTQDFFIHTNAVSPNILFKKDRFGYYSSCWQTVRSNIQSRQEQKRRLVADNFERPASSMETR